jgi:hypothetical protein
MNKVSQFCKIKFINLNLTYENKQNISASLIGLMFTSCAVIRPGEVGVKQSLGVLATGKISRHCFLSLKSNKTSIQTNNLEFSLEPSRKGLSITSQISILYKLDKSRVPDIRNIGLNYESIIAMSLDQPLQMFVLNFCKRHAFRNASNY